MLTLTCLIGIFQRAFEKQVKKNRKENLQKWYSHIPNSPYMDEKEKKRKKEAQKNKAQSFLFGLMP